jgi:hypothetical protein
MKKKNIFIVILLSNFIFAEEIPKIVQNCFDKMAADSVHSYAYRKTVSTPEETRIISFDPSLEKGDQWQLLSINGNPPNKKELKKFYKETSYQPDGDQQGNTMTSDDMYDFSVVNETEEEIVFLCKIENENEKMQDKMACKIQICKADTTLKSLKMELTEPVSPVISVKLEEFSMEMDFFKMKETGASLIQQASTSVKGKAMLFKELNEQVTERYYDYRLVD